MSRRTWGERSTCKVQNYSLSNINFSFWCVNMHVEGEWKENIAVFQKSLTTSFQSPPPSFVLIGRGMIMGFFFLLENRMKPMPKKAGHFNTSLYLTSSFSYFVLFWRGMEGKYGSFSEITYDFLPTPPPPYLFWQAEVWLWDFFSWENRMKPMPKKAGHFNTSLYFTSSFSYFALFNKFDRL